MPVKSLQVLYLGSTIVDKSLMTFKIDQGIRIESPFFSYLIKTDEGNVLVDSGMHPDDATKSAKARGEDLSWPKEYHLPECLKKMGLSIDDINTLIITHLHPDHIGYLNKFTKAEIVIQKTEYLSGLEPVNRQHSPERFNGYENLGWNIIDGDHVLMPGLTLIYTPGHSVGHQSVMIDLRSSGVIILAGDAVFIQENIDKEIIPRPFADAREALLSIKRLKVWAQVRNARILPGHDMEYYRQKVKKSPEAYT
jgi:N-acyl homoserine lactone hydrolase